MVHSSPPQWVIVYENQAIVCCMLPFLCVMSLIAIASEHSFNVLFPEMVVKLMICIKFQL